jgi:actin-related protein 9
VCRHPSMYSSLCRLLIIILFAPSRHVLFTSLGLPARPIMHSFAISTPPRLPITARERFVQLCFEKLFMPGLTLLEPDVCQLYAHGLISGLVLDVGRTHSTASAVFDSIPVAGATVFSPMGTEDLDKYLAHLLLQANPDLPTVLSDSSTPLAPPALGDALLNIVQSLKADEDTILFASDKLNLGLVESSSAGPTAAADQEEELDDVAKVVATGKLNKFTSKAKKNKANGGGGGGTPESDTVTVPHPLSASLPAVTIGPERHRYAEPLFDPSVLAGVPALFSAGGRPEDKTYTNVQLENKAFSLPEAAAAVVRTLEPARRTLAWEHLVVTGDLALIKGKQTVAIVYREAGPVGINP